MGVAGSSFLFACGASAREVGNHQNNIGAGDVVVAVSPNGNTDGHEVGTKQNVGIHSRAENDNEVYNPANDHTLAADVAKVFKSLVEVGANAGGNSTVVEQASEIDATREYANPEYDDAWSALELNNKLSKLAAAQEIETKQNLKSEHGAMYSTAHHSTLDSRAAAKIPTSSFADCDCPSKPHARMVPDAEHDGGVSGAGSECDCSSSGLEEGMQTAERVVQVYNAIQTLNPISSTTRLSQLGPKERRVFLTTHQGAIRKLILLDYLKVFQGRDCFDGECVWEDQSQQIADMSVWANGWRALMYGNGLSVNHAFAQGGACSDTSYTDQNSCEGARQIWTSSFAVDDLVLIKSNPVDAMSPEQSQFVVNRIGVVTKVWGEWSISQTLSCSVTLLQVDHQAGRLAATQDVVPKIYARKLIGIERLDL